MKLTITHLKAPWPEGAKVGDVVELDSVPAWALGKCKPAAEDAQVAESSGQAKADAEAAADKQTKASKK